MYVVQFVVSVVDERFYSTPNFISNGHCPMYIKLLRVCTNHTWIDKKFHLIHWQTDIHCMSNVKVFVMSLAEKLFYSTQIFIAKDIAQCIHPNNESVPKQQLDKHVHLIHVQTDIHH